MPMNGLERLIGKCSYCLAMVAGAAILLMMVLTCADVFLRYFFNAPIEGALDLTQMLMVVVVFFALAYCGWTGGHIVVDLLREMIPAKILVPLAIVVNAVGAAAMLTIAWQSIVTAQGYMDTGETPMTLLVPKYPFILIVSFGALTYAIVLLYRTFRPEERLQDNSGS
jgi:TRAP-type C4-dicarboxylate transport system permease small subunit